MDARAGLYEMYRILGVKYLYKSAVGTTTNGEVLMGIDFDSRDIVATYQGTAALQPKTLGPVWRDHTVVVPPARAMKQKWLLTSNLQDDAPARGAFTLQVTSTASNSTGSIWVEYHLEFASPRVPTRPVAISLAAVNMSQQTNRKNMSRTSAFKSPQVGADPFYVMSDKDYVWGVQPGFTAKEVETIPALPNANIWSANKIWEIVGPAGKEWMTDATKPPAGLTYGIAVALTISALKQLAGVR